jgi:hypothetical protein
VLFASSIKKPPAVESFRRILLPFACVLALYSNQSRAQESSLDKDRYYAAVDYCRQSASPRPMALSPDKRILCFTGEVAQNMDLSPVKELEQDGLFVVRSPGGNATPAIDLSNLLHDRRATVIAYHCCISACATFFLIATDQAYVLKGTLIAWHYPLSRDPFRPFCTSAEKAHDGGPKKLHRGLCNASGDGVGYGPYPAETQFFKSRVIDPLFEPPPDSKYARKIVSSIFAETSVYRDIAWTIHPRFYPRLFKTKIVYEAYPESQAEVDDMLARLHMNFRVIYDP